MAYSRNFKNGGREVPKISTKIYDLSNPQDVIKAISSVYNIIENNAKEAKDLWEKRLGNQDVYDREKEVFSQINNKYVENRLHEAVSMYVGYLLSKPIQYINASADTPSDGMIKLNDYSRFDGKQGKDISLLEEMLVTGTAFRLIEPNKEFDIDMTSPFKTATLSIENAFVIYGQDAYQTPLICGAFGKNTDKNGTSKSYIEAYTNSIYIYVEDFSASISKEKIKVNAKKVNTSGFLPIIEYPINTKRQGIVEILVDIQNAINEVNCDGLDGLRQAIEAIIWGNNIKALDEKERKSLETAHGGWIFTSDASNELKAHLEMLVNNLDQIGIETLKSSTLDAFYAVAGIPNRSGKNTDQNGQGVLLSQGWSQLEARCKIIEEYFKQSEMQFLRQALYYCKSFKESSLATSDIVNVMQIGVSIPRNFADALQSKVQAFVMLITQGIAPEIALDLCQLTNDTGKVIKQSEQYQKRIGYNWSNFVGTPKVKETTEIIETKNKINGEDILNG